MAKVPIYSIDSGVPVPPMGRGMPLNQLDVGESFVFPQEKRQSVLTMANRIKRQTGKEFALYEHNLATGP